MKRRKKNQTERKMLKKWNRKALISCLRAIQYDYYELMSTDLQTSINVHTSHSLQRLTFSASVTCARQCRYAFFPFTSVRENDKNNQNIQLIILFLFFT